MILTTVTARFGKLMSSRHSAFGTHIAVALCLLLSASASAWGQSWSYVSGSSGPIYYNGGGVGIGTATPSSSFMLDLESGGAVTSGNHSVGWMARATTSESGVIVGYHGNGTIADYPIVRAGGSSAAGLALGGDSVDQAALFIKVGGNVGIGTTSPVHPLQVAGTIGAEEVIVSSTGADYVFDDAYRLAPLSEVAAFVKENHHLPDIPSAEEGKEKGVSLGEMQTKLLAKVEELTLHMIEAEERNKLLAQENVQLKQETQKLQERVERIEAGSTGK
jgi:hypothetical protein